MSLRVTGGEARGRLVSSPSADNVRPTASKVRQSIFNILGQNVRGARFLDLFAGTGIMGLEALSRGAGALVSVEMNPNLSKALQKTLIQFSFQADLRVGDVKNEIAKLAKYGTKSQKNCVFDIIYADPPYKNELMETLVQLIESNDLLAQDGILIIEHANTRDALRPMPYGKLACYDKRDYGQTSVSFFKNENQTGDH